MLPKYRLNVTTAAHEKNESCSSDAKRIPTNLSRGVKLKKYNPGWNKAE